MLSVLKPSLIKTGCMASCFLISVISCTKTVDDPGGSGGGGGNTLPATINIINAVAGGTDAQVQGLPNPIPYGASAKADVVAGASTLHIYPVGNPSQPYFTNSVATVPGGKYSLFVAGKPGATSTLSLQDTVHTYADSTAGIRFVMLSPDAGPVSVNLAGKPAGSLFHDYHFGDHSLFLKFPADSQNSSYTVEFRRSGGDSLLLVYGFNAPLFQNATVVFDGLAGNQTLNTFLINN